VSAFISCSPLIYTGVVISLHIEIVIQKGDAAKVYRAAVEVFLVNSEGERRTKNEILTVRQAVKG